MRLNVLSGAQSTFLQMANTNPIREIIDLGERCLALNNCIDYGDDYDGPRFDEGTRVKVAQQGLNLGFHQVGYSSVWGEISDSSRTCYSGWFMMKGAAFYYPEDIEIYPQVGFTMVRDGAQVTDGDLRRNTEKILPSPLTVLTNSYAAVYVRDDETPEVFNLQSVQPRSSSIG